MIDNLCTCVLLLLFVLGQVPTESPKPQQKTFQGGFRLWSVKTSAIASPLGCVRAAPGITIKTSLCSTTTQE